jgi:hypothetical protein
MRWQRSGRTTSGPRRHNVFGTTLSNCGSRMPVNLAGISVS